MISRVNEEFVFSELESAKEEQEKLEEPKTPLLDKYALENRILQRILFINLDFDCF